MEPNPYQPPRELGTKPEPVKWNTESKVLAALTLIALLFAVVAGGYSLNSEKLLLSITMMTAGIVPGAFFIVLLYRFQPDPLGLIAVILVVAAAMVCMIIFAATLFARFYLSYNPILWTEDG